MSYKLLIEDFDRSNFNYIIEEGDGKSPSRVYIEGPYMCAEKVNKNKRRYIKEEMLREVERYKHEEIDKMKALGELNHPSTAEVDLERACHMVTELKPDGNEVIGRSKILSTPCGKIVESLIRDGVSVGMSTRSLGRLVEEAGGINRVEDMKLIAIDCVADPSYAGAFVDGILESKQWICDNNGNYCEVCEQFDNTISTLPSKNVNEYLVNAVGDFLKAISKS